MKIYTAKEAANAINITYGDIRSAIRMKLIPTQRNGNNYVILEEDLKEFAEAHGFEFSDELATANS